MCIFEPSSVLYRECEEIYVVIASLDPWGGRATNIS